MVGVLCLWVLDHDLDIKKVIVYTLYTFNSVVSMLIFYSLYESLYWSVHTRFNKKKTRERSRRDREGERVRVLSDLLSPMVSSLPMSEVEVLEEVDKGGELGLQPVHAKKKPVPDNTPPLRTKPP